MSFLSFPRPLSISFLFRTSGKEYHSQADSTSLIPASLAEWVGESDRFVDVNRFSFPNHLSERPWISTNEIFTCQLHLLQTAYSSFICSAYYALTTFTDPKQCPSTTLYDFQVLKVAHHICIQADVTLPLRCLSILVMTRWWFWWKICSFIPKRISNSGLKGNFWKN